MNKKTIAIILELVPLVSAIISFIFIILPYNSEIIKHTVGITTVLSFFGFVFFFIGKNFGKENKMIRILGIFDWLATIYVILLYTIVIFSFGL